MIPAELDAPTVSHRAPVTTRDMIDAWSDGMCFIPVVAPALVAVALVLGGPMLHPPERPVAREVGRTMGEWRSGGGIR